MAVKPETRYARSGDVSIAYQVVGDEDGPLDLVFVHGFVGHLEVEAENPRVEAFFERLSSVGRVIRFDRRGTGLSDRLREVPALESRMDDLRAVMDAAKSGRAVLVATFEASSIAVVFGATYPERVAGLVLYNPVAKGIRSPDHQWARFRSEEELDAGSSRSARAGDSAISWPRTSANLRRPSPKTRKCRTGGQE